MKKPIIILIILIIFLTGCTKCVEKKDGYSAKTKFGRTYFLDEDIDKAKEMYSGLIVKEFNYCTKWE